MLAVFHHSIAKCPESMKCTNTESTPLSLLKGEPLRQYFASLHPCSVSVNLGSSGFMAYSSHGQNPFLPSLFAVDDIFCLFQGHIENVAPLKQQYDLTKIADEVSIIIEDYCTLRDRCLHPADHVVRNVNGKFAFILFDSTSKTVHFWGC